MVLEHGAVDNAAHKIVGEKIAHFAGIAHQRRSRLKIGDCIPRRALLDFHGILQSDGVFTKI